MPSLSLYHSTTVEQAQATGRISDIQYSLEHAHHLEWQGKTFHVVQRGEYANSRSPGGVRRLQTLQCTPGAFPALAFYSATLRGVRLIATPATDSNGASFETPQFFGEGGQVRSQHAQWRARVSEDRNELAKLVALAAPPQYDFENPRRHVPSPLAFLHHLERDGESRVS